MSFTRTLRAVGGAVMAGALLFGTAPTVSADEIRDQQWALDAFDADAVWKVSTGKGVIVAVIDDGVNGNHPDLKGNVLPGKNFSTGDPADQETKNQHGTAMASIIAGHGHGVDNADGVKGLAPDAKILPVKESDTDGSTLQAVSYAEPLRYAVDHGAKVVNMSFGGPTPPSDEEKAAIAYAWKHDVVLVAASGNDGSATPNYPAAAPGVVAVGAVSRPGADGLFKVWEDSDYGDHLMLTAPGTQIRDASIGSGYQGTKGTSDAAAYVSGAVALLRAKFPNLTAGQIVNRLTKTALIPDNAGVTKTPDPHYGYGIIRPYAALTRNIPAGSKDGPLKVPDLSAAGASPSADAAATGTGTDDNDTMQTVLGVAGFVVIVLVVVGLIIGIVVWRKSKNRRNGPPPGGPGGPGTGWGGSPYPPQQGGNPYQQQPQGPYGATQPPQGQWPQQ